MPERGCLKDIVPRLLKAGKYVRREQATKGDVRREVGEGGVLLGPKEQCRQFSLLLDRDSNYIHYPFSDTVFPFPHPKGQVATQSILTRVYAPMMVLASVASTDPLGSKEEAVAVELRVSSLPKNAAMTETQPCHSPCTCYVADS